MIGTTLGIVASKAAPVVSGMLFELGRGIVKETINYYSTKAAVEAALRDSDISRQVNHIERCVMSFGQ